MKTLREMRRDYIRSILEDNGWDIEKASTILKIPKSVVRREVRRLNGPRGKGSSKGTNSEGQE